MGEIADMMLDGTLCEQCGGALGDIEHAEPPGHPRTCRTCKRARWRDRKITDFTVLFDSYAQHEHHGGRPALEAAKACWGSIRKTLRPDQFEWPDTPDIARAVSIARREGWRLNAGKSKRRKRRRLAGKDGAG